MGDTTQEPWLLGAWTMGFFGPFVFPGNLERAVQQSRGWPEAADAVNRHQAFVRVTTTYAGGMDADAPCIPKGYDALQELAFVTRVALALGRLDGAIAYFNPNGEKILPFDRLVELIDYHTGVKLPAYPAWVNVRMFKLRDVEPWTVMDTVGLPQLDAVDHQACFPADVVDANDVARFMWNIVDYQRKAGPVVQHGDTTDGPGNRRWRAFHGETLLDPPRRVLRWVPADAEVPERLLAGIDEDT